MQNELQLLLKMYQNLSSPELSAIKGVQAKLSIKPNVSPIFIRTRPVPFKLQPLVEQELDNLENAGIIDKIPTSNWATPIVPIVKRNGKIRICGDYKTTINRYLNIDDHPFPTIDELFTKLSGSIKYSKIDLTQTYLQLEVVPEQRRLLTISTCKGLYKINRMMYGIASALSIWQREIKNILQDIPGIAILFDDIVITGENNTVHFNRLKLVLEKLHQHNIRINMEKSNFFVDKVNYCGYTLDKESIHKEQSKVEAIKQIPNF